MPRGRYAVNSEILLIGAGSLERTVRAGDRRIYYRLRSGTWDGVVDARLRLLVRIRDVTERCSAGLGSGWAWSGQVSRDRPSSAYDRPPLSGVPGSLVGKCVLCFGDHLDPISPQPELEQLVTTTRGRHRHKLPGWRAEALRTTFWLAPCIMVVVAGGLFAVTFTVDLAAYHHHLTLPFWIRTGSADAGRQVLIAIAAAIITVIGVVFSITSHDCHNRLP